MIISIYRDLSNKPEFDEKYTGTVNSVIKALTIRSAEFPWLVDRAAKLYEWYENGEYQQIINQQY